MIAGESTQIIQRPAKDIYEFILNPEQYKRADTKIGHVYSLDWHGHLGEVRYSGRFRGVRTPAVRQIISVELHRRIDFRSKPGSFAHFAAPFHGFFVLEPVDATSTKVFHREALDPRIPFKWLMERWLGRWLAEDTPAEVMRLKRILEART